MSKAVVLLSGGMDSTTALAEAVLENDSVLALSFGYGSIHEAAELEASILVARYFCVLHQIIHLDPTFFKGGGSALLNERAMPHATYHELMAEEGPSPTVVPFRNAVLLSLATAIAASRGYDFVYAGMHAEDAHNWAYPDCTPEFLGPFGAAVYVGTYHKVRLRYPFIWKSKSDIVQRAASIGAPLGLTWSCYLPTLRGSHLEHCGLCPTCIERYHAFEVAGYSDPVKYYTRPVRSNKTPINLKRWPHG